MQYGDITFYAACLAVAELIMLGVSLCDGKLARLRRARPWAWQGLVLLLTAVCLYASDSNKTINPPPVRPAVRMSGVWLVPTPDGFKVVGLTTNDTASAVSNETDSAESPAP